MSKLSSLARQYAADPKNPETGLRRNAKGVWVLQRQLDGHRYNISSKDPADVWEKFALQLIGAASHAEEKQIATAYGPLFKDMAAIYEAQLLNRKLGTQRPYRPALRRAVAQFGLMHMREITPKDIRAFLRSQPGAVKTVNNLKTVISSVYSVYFDCTDDDYNPTKGITVSGTGRSKTIRTPPTAQQVQAVKASVSDPDALPALLLLCTGERIGEALGIQLKDIDFSAGTISVTKAVEWVGNQPHIKCTKTASGVRTVPLLSLLRSALDPYRSLPPETFVIGLQTQPVTYSWYRNAWGSFWAKHGFARLVTRTKRENGKERTYKVWECDVTAHQFRHEYVCLLCSSGVPEAVAIQIIGHANASMIHEVYMHLQPQMISDAAARLNAVL